VGCYTTIVSTIGGALGFEGALIIEAMARGLPIACGGYGGTG